MVDDKIYKLDQNGASYNAVLQVHKSVIGITKEFTNGAKGLSKQDLGQKITESLQSLDAGLVRKTGLSSPVIQVKDTEQQAYPRAYTHTPQVYATQINGQLDLYMYCPVGYDGTNFSPDDASLITDEGEQQKIGNMLFAGGWMDPISFYSLKPQGVDVPDNYQRPDQFENAPSHAKLCFIAQGRTLDMIEEYEERAMYHKQNVDCVMDEICRIVEAHLSEGLHAQLDEGESFYINKSHSIARNKQDEIEFCISVCRGGETQMMQAGQSLTLEDNPYFCVEEKGKDYRILPNMESKQGGKLFSLMQKIPPAPQISDYPELMADLPFTPGRFDVLLGVNGKVPRIDEFEGHKILIYNTDTVERGDFNPPDSVYLPSSVYQWLNADKEDETMGIEPPPQSGALREELTTLNYQIESPQQPVLKQNGDEPELY
ncbi:MAG: hypothetical protein ACRBDL_04385 [Alphaproteobacteria bacterium]